MKRKSSIIGNRWLISVSFLFQFLFPIGLANDVKNFSEFDDVSSKLDAILARISALLFRSIFKYRDTWQLPTVINFFSWKWYMHPPLMFVRWNAEMEPALEGFLIINHS